MITIKVKKIDGLVLPNSATKYSSGYDIKSISDPEIVGDFNETDGYNRIDYIQYRTGLFVAPERTEELVPPFIDGNDKFVSEHILTTKWHLLIHPRSSISKYNLTLANSIGLIDNDYRGEILLRFKYNWQPEDFFVKDGSVFGKINHNKIYKKGDYIGQLVCEYSNMIKWEIVENLDDTERGAGGFGSTNNK